MASAQIDKILHIHRGRPTLPPAQADKLKTACFTYMQVHSALVQHYHPGTPLFNVTQKHHSLIHIGLVGLFINPAYGGVWKGEDMMRVVRRLVAASSNGNTVVGAQPDNMHRYCRAIGFDLSFPEDL